MSDRVERKLAAIVAADVVGYSRLMGADEEGTIAAVRNLQLKTLEPLIAEYGGRMVKTMGDGFLIEFPSVVAGVEAAIAAQEELSQGNTDVPTDRSIQLRIGIHVGDIVIEGSDIFGEGVNIAARIEPLSRPGGVGISDDAYRQVRDRLSIAWTDGGEHAVKNISRAVRIWHWNNGSAEEPQAEKPEQLVPPERPSVAVLPFDNMSGDPEQEFFADGMAEDLITDLSKISGLFVVARNSTFAFKGKTIDIQDAARQLGVRYVVEGSVRKAGTRARINVQLIEASTGGHIWAERYDGSLDAVFELQDDVCSKVVSALKVQLKGEEENLLRQVHTRNVEAYELFVRAKSTPYPPIPERIAAARSMFEQVVEMDPDFAGGYAGLSWMVGFHALWGHEDPNKLGKKAEELARKAISVDESFGWSYVGLGVALLVQRRLEDALDATNKAVALQPNDADAHAFHGLLLTFSGDNDGALATVDKAIRLSPQFINGPYLNLRSQIKFLSGDYKGAIESHEENVARGGPVGPPALCWAATCYFAAGEMELAAKTVAILTSRFPAFRLEGWSFFNLFRSDEESERIHKLMLDAGVPR